MSELVASSLGVLNLGVQLRALWFKLAGIHLLFGLSVYDFRFLRDKNDMGMNSFARCFGISIAEWNKAHSRFLCESSCFLAQATLTKTKGLGFRLWGLGFRV